MQTSEQHEFDAIVIGAGHNGLAAAAVLAGAGRRVLVLEKTGYVGGMSGTIHPEQMLAARTLSDRSAHATPVPGLYLCGSSCHPGPGVTFLPGYGCGKELLASALR